MAKLSKRAKKALFQLADNIMRMIILPLFQWTTDSEGAFFFIIVGDKYMTDVAWSNTDGLAVDGALAVASDPNAAAAFEFIKTTYDIALEDNLNDLEFNKAFNAHETPSKDDSGWVSIEDYLDADKDPERPSDGTGEDRVRSA